MDFEAGVPLMPGDAAVQYCRSMEEIRRRIDLVSAVLAGRVATGYDWANVELIFIQLRKVLEHIAFASLTANKEQYSSVHANFASHWKAKAMLDELEKINPEFYPVPLHPPIQQGEGRFHFPGPITDGFLTKDEFARLYDASSEVLHTRNPFSGRDPVIQIGYSVNEWVARIQRLLGWHLVRLIDGSVWVVNIPSDGPVHVYPAEPTPE